MKDNKNYDYTDEFSDIIHTVRFINAAELSGVFFSVWGIERSGFFNDRGKWAKGFENQRV